MSHGQAIGAIGVWYSSFRLVRDLFYDNYLADGRCDLKIPEPYLCISGIRDKFRTMTLGFQMVAIGHPQSPSPRDSLPLVPCSRPDVHPPLESQLKSRPNVEEGPLRHLLLQSSSAGDRQLGHQSATAESPQECHDSPQTLDPLIFVRQEIIKSLAQEGLQWFGRSREPIFGFGFRTLADWLGMGQKLGHTWNPIGKLVVLLDSKLDEVPSKSYNSACTGGIAQLPHTSQRYLPEDGEEPERRACQTKCPPSPAVAFSSRRASLTVAGRSRAAL